AQVTADLSRAAATWPSTIPPPELQIPSCHDASQTAATIHAPLSSECTSSYGHGVCSDTAVTPQTPPLLDREMAPALPATLPCSLDILSCGCLPRDRGACQCSACA